MRICVLQSAFTTPIDNFRCDPSPWLPEHTCEHHFIRKASAAREVRALARRGRFDLFINLCDGGGDSDEAGIDVVVALERLGVAFTGADRAFYEPTREVMKLAAHAAGIPTPPYVFAADLSAVDVAAQRLRFPLLVKHANSYGSIGMTRGSRVTTPEALRAEVGRFLDCFGGAMIEEFIEGREFTVLVAENPEDPRAPVAFTPLELLFPPGETFKHYALKFVDFARMRGVPVTDPALAGRLAALSCGLFVGLDGRSYGRCDLRMDQAGELHMLEINPNCGIFYPLEGAGCADISLGHDPRGHRGFLELIVASALSRERRRRRTSARSAALGAA